MEQAAVQLGSVLAGRYRIDRVLGQGGMGIVVQAMHLQLHQPVALKFLLPEVLNNKEIVQRFLREAQAAVRLRSEHVARVIDVGTLDTNAPYMVLEYLEGCDLSNFPRAHLTVGRIVDLLLQACEALAEAHALGIVHRDIKPANFFVTRRADGTPLLKVLDFGISKVPVRDSNLTATQAVMGTPAYMSPEQMRSSRDVDHRSDVWALGIVLYELLQGAPPFGGDTFSSMILKVVTEPLPRLTVALPPGLDAVIYRCLEKDPAQRFQNVAELAQALARYAGSTTQAAISVQRTTGVTGITGMSSQPSTISGAAHARTTPPGKTRRWPLVAGVGTVAVAAGIAVLVARGGAASTPAAAAAPASVAKTATAAPTSAPEPAPARSPGPAQTPAPEPAQTPAPAPVPAPEPVAADPAPEAPSHPAAKTADSDSRGRDKRKSRGSKSKGSTAGATGAPSGEGDLLDSRN